MEPCSKCGKEPCECPVEETKEVENTDAAAAEEAQPAETADKQ